MRPSSARFRVGLLASHPVQYQAPWFRALARECELEVFFAHRQSAAEQGRAGFGVAFDWDVDLRGGYRNRFLNNIARRPGVDRFGGCDTPEIGAIIGQSDMPFDAFIVMGWYLKSYLQAVAACRRAAVPVLARGDSQLRTPRSLWRRLAMEVRQRWLLRRFDGFLSVGARHREYLEHFGVPAERIFFAPHCVDNEWFAARAAQAQARRRQIRAEWGAAENDLVALFVGKLQSNKRPQDLLDATARLGCGSTPAACVPVFVGAGEQESEMREKAARLRVKSHFAGFKNQTELPVCYAAADVLVLPGRETWGLVVNEAMACGVPAVVSDAVGCGPDLVEEGRTGFVFPVGNVDALAGCLAHVAELRGAGHDFRPALRHKMERYSIATAVAGTIEAVERLAGRRRGVDATARARR